jgi:hypothetical protein
MFVFIFAAAIINRILTWTTDLPFSALAVTQTIAVLAIFTIDRVYTKLVAFLAVYAGLAVFVEIAYMRWYFQLSCSVQYCIE